MDLQREREEAGKTSDLYKAGWLAKAQGLRKKQMTSSYILKEEAMRLSHTGDLKIGERQKSKLFLICTAGWMMSFTEIEKE